MLSAPINHMKLAEGTALKGQKVLAVSAEPNSTSGAITLTRLRLAVMRRAPLNRADSEAIPRSVFSGFCGLTSHHISSRRSAFCARSDR